MQVFKVHIELSGTIVNRSHSIKIVLLVLCVLFSFALQAQDVENVLKQKPVKVSGGVSATTTLYNAQGIANRRDPFYWMLNANLNFNILGIIQAPFSMTLSEQSK